MLQKYQHFNSNKYGHDVKIAVVKSGSYMGCEWGLNLQTDVSDLA
jgi:hypothetical protein